MKANKPKQKKFEEKRRKRTSKEKTAELEEKETIKIEIEPLSKVWARIHKQIYYKGSQ